jgi:hypothetical protein
MRILQNIRKSLGTILLSRSEVHDESRRIINSGNVCHFSVRELNIPSTFQNAKGQDIQNKFLFCFVVSYFKGRTYGTKLSNLEYYIARELCELYRSASTVRAVIAQLI